MSSREVAVFLAVAAAVLVVSGGLGHDEKCTVSLQAPAGSPWKTLGHGARDVSLSRVQQLVGKHGLTLVEGPPPPHAPQALVSVACEKLGPMWVGLPDPSAFLADEGTPLQCQLDNLKDKVSTMLGLKQDTPKQYPGQPRRVYMANYCGVKFPVTAKSDVARRMHENTRRLERKMNSWRR